jgi:Cu(I)/Ag(I) efflux system membrane protein CusA/SilA
MSLGGIAIAIGVMVDAAVVMVENAHKRLEQSPDADRRRVVVAAAKEMGKPLFFSLLVITVSFLPRSPSRRRSRCSSRRFCR